MKTASVHDVPLGLLLAEKPLIIDARGNRISEKGQDIFCTTAFRDCTTVDPVPSGCDDD